jgi:hypothetical protein
MVNRILVGGFAAALAGAAMLAISSAPASAFTLISPSLEKPVAAADIQHVWCNGWGCGGWRYRRGWGPGWGPGWGVAPVVPYYGYGYRHCWRGYYGHLHCNW